MPFNVQHRVKSDKDARQYVDLSLSGGTLSRCCGMKEISLGGSWYSNDLDYNTQIVLNRDAYIKILVEKLFSTVFNVGKRMQGHNDFASPSMMVLTDFVPMYADKTDEELPAILNAIVDPSTLSTTIPSQFRTYHLIQFLKKNPQYGTITITPVFRSNGNYRRRTPNGRKEAISGLSMEARHILTSAIWCPNLELCDIPNRVWEYKSLASVFNPPKSGNIKVVPPKEADKVTTANAWAFQLTPVAA